MELVSSVTRSLSKTIRALSDHRLTPTHLEGGVSSGHHIAHHASELCALGNDEPYLKFHRDKVTLCPDIRFLPKVVSAFHVNQDINLPSFVPSPSTPLEQRFHTLDVR